MSPISTSEECYLCGTEEPGRSHIFDSKPLRVLGVICYSCMEERKVGSTRRFMGADHGEAVGVPGFGPVARRC